MITRRGLLAAYCVLIWGLLWAVPAQGMSTWRMTRYFSDPAYHNFVGYAYSLCTWADNWGARTEYKTVEVGDCDPQIGPRKECRCWVLQGSEEGGYQYYMEIGCPPGTMCDGCNPMCLF
jgi:hypothetical protein